MENKYKPAPEVERIAQVWIAKHHSHLLDPSVRMFYRWVEKAPRKNGKIIYGKAQIVPEMALSLLGHNGPAFCLIISKDRWFMLTPPPARGADRPRALPLRTERRRGTESRNVGA